MLPSYISSLLGFGGSSSNTAPTGIVGDPTKTAMPANSGFGQGAPIAPGGAGFMGNQLGTGLGMNVGTGQLALGALNSLGGLYSAFQANGLARDSFNFQKQYAQANLANSMKSYNTRLEDTAKSRASIEGTDQSDYVARNRLS